MKNIILALLVISIFSCSEKQADLTVKANIKGLKKGVVYLRKAEDSTLITVDSVLVSGDSEIVLESELESPQIFILDLDKNSSENERITFFADKGITEINTTLKNFVFDAKINGTQQQKVLEDYKLLMSRINERNLDLIKESFEAGRDGDSLKILDVEKRQESLIKTRYLQTVNFALNNKDSEVAPYLALTELYNARLKYLDTIYKVLSPKVKKSKYGKELGSFIDEIRTKESE